MSLHRWQIGLGLTALVLALAGAGRAAAQESHSGEGKGHQDNERQQFYKNLTEIHNYGASLYNNGDWAGCYRLFEGCLMTIRPHLAAHHAELHKNVTDAMAQAQADPSMVNRAWILREALLKVRKAHASEKGAARPEGKPPVRPEEKPPVKPEEKPPVTTKKTLWDRLGGEEGVSAIVEDAVASAARDPKVNLFRGNKIKLDAAAMQRFKKRMVEEASALTGGPLRYEGEGMKKAHTGMGITDAEFDAFMGHVKDALKKHNVSPADAGTILTALEAKRKDIVEAKKPPADRKPEEKKLGPKPEDKKPGDKSSPEKKPDGNPFAPRTDKKPITEKPADNKPAEIKAGKPTHVSGKVTCEGKPITKGEIGFHPATGKSITAAIKEEGDYSLDILPGEYVITVKADKGGLSPKYGDKKTTPLRITINPGKQVDDLALTK